MTMGDGVEYRQGSRPRRRRREAEERRRRKQAPMVDGLQGSEVKHWDDITFDSSSSLQNTSSITSRNHGLHNRPGKSRSPHLRPHLLTVIQLGGFTLTSTILYLSVSLHQRNRIYQSSLLRQQSFLIDNTIAPKDLPPPPPSREVQAGLLETAKDKWNAELERNVRKLQTYDWAALWENVENSAGRLFQRAGEKGAEAVREVQK